MMRALLVLALLATPALADEAASIHVRGTIAAITGLDLKIQPATGAPLTLRLGEKPKIVVATHASLADVAPGAYVGIANTGGDGEQDALEVHIFPERMRGTGEGQGAWDIGKASRMTNGAVAKKVEAYDGQTLTLTYEGGRSDIMVRPNTPVVRFAPGTVADLKTGAAVFVRDGKARPDGSIAATDIVVGQGVKPPL